MQRLYYLTDTLDAAENVTQDLLNHGVLKNQLHWVAKNDGELERHQLPTATAFDTTDLIPAGESGLLIGALAGTLGCLFLYGSGLSASIEPIAYVGIFVLSIGLFTWLGGFIGLSLNHYKLATFKPALENGQKLLMIDTPTDASGAIQRFMSHHPEAIIAGSGSTWNNPLHPHHL